MQKRQDLIEIVKCCETRFNRGPASEWKHSDFGELSRKIQLDTDIVISPNTLKRIFGKIAVDEDYLPQQATIEALAKYGRYTPSDTDIPTDTPQKLEPAFVPKPSQFKKNLIPIAVLVIILIIAGLLFFNRSKSNSVLSGSITPSNIEGVLPATAYFNLDVPQTDDSLFINFGDKTPFVYILPGQKTAAHVYKLPGVFKVFLQTAKKRMDSASVSIRSNKWVGFGFRRQAEMQEHYYAFPFVKRNKDSLFHLSNSQLSKVGLDTNGLLITRLTNYTPLKNIADNFIFEASFRNQVNEQGVYCNAAQFQINGIDNFIRFKFVNSGCTYRVLNVVSEQVYDGTKINLSQFTTNLNQWNTVKLINRNKQVSLFLNGKELFSGTYQQSLGEMQGLFLEFEGNGYIRNCDFKSLDGAMLYHF